MRASYQANGRGARVGIPTGEVGLVGWVAREQEVVPVSVEVKLPTVLRTHADGQASISSGGATVGEVFQDLVARYPSIRGNLLDESGGLHKFVNVYKNDDDIRYLDQLDTKLEDGDTLSIIPAVAGGAGPAPS
jgi:molybdopterin synthase sulfur carrier subunit